MTVEYSIANALRYIRRPYFPAGRDRVGEAALRHLAQLLALSIVIMTVLSGLVGGIVASALGELPENVNATMAQTNPGMLLLMGVIFAPIIEEVIFRSWLGGRKTCLLGLPVLASLAAVLVAASHNVSPMISFGLAGGLGALIFGIARQYNALPSEGQKQGRWALFPFAFYGSAAFFALIHLTNYVDGLSSPILFILVLPQLIIGLVIGYVRMRFGLIAAIWFHALYNLVLLGLFLVSQSLAPVTDGATAITLIPTLAASLFAA